jgi:hypothetical protein
MISRNFAKFGQNQAFKNTNKFVKNVNMGSIFAPTSALNFNGLSHNFGTTPMSNIQNQFSDLNSKFGQN